MIFLIYCTKQSILFIIQTNVQLAYMIQFTFRTTTNKKKKDIFLPHLLTTIDSLLQKSSELTLTQKSAIFKHITQVLNSKSKILLLNLQKFRKQVFYSCFTKSAERTRQTNQSTKKKVPQIADPNDTIITVNDVLRNIHKNPNISLNISLPLLSQPALMVTPIGINQNKNIEIPPFPNETMVEMSEGFNKIMSSSSKARSVKSQTKQEENLVNYQKLLATADNDFQIKHDRKRNAGQSNTKRRTEKKIAKVVDTHIEISQEDMNETLKDVEYIKTKLKLSKQRLKSTCEYYKVQMGRLNSELTDGKGLIERFAALTNIINTKVRAISHYSPQDFMSIGGEQMENSLYSFMQIGEIDQNRAVQNNHNNELRLVMKNLIDKEMYNTNPVSLNNICYKKSVKGHLKGEFFYELLHMNYCLQQKNVEGFGDILISWK